MVQPHILFRKKFSQRNLTRIYEEHFSKTKLKGVDRLNSLHFKERAKNEIKLISKKALGNNYKFSPYLEMLQGKGRDKAPRVFAIPTIRDRVALYALKELLFDLFPQCIRRKFANKHIQEIKISLNENHDKDLAFFRTDIKNFYGSVDRYTLINRLQKKIKSPKILSMIERSVTRSIVPKVYKRKDLNNYKITGIPQGLSISNILAEIYLDELDQDILSNEDTIYYCRYVDDILILADRNKLYSIVENLNSIMNSLNLELNLDKTYSNIKLQAFPNANYSESFEYLGYLFSYKYNTSNIFLISPKRGAEEKFIRSILGLVSEYKNAFRKILNSKRENDVKSLKIELISKVFIFRLNLKLTGSISENRKYGWIFYFIELNDKAVLYRIDNTVNKIIKKVDESSIFGSNNLKKISVAYFRALYSPLDGYIHNYNSYRNDQQKKDFLVNNGYISADSGQNLDESEIRELFRKVKQASLDDLVRDEAFLY